MPGTMSKADLITDLKASLLDAATVFKAPADADFVRHLEHAALDLGRKRPRTLVGEVTLVADTPNYPVPADLLQIKLPLWGSAERRQRNPWARDWPGQLPRATVVNVAGGQELWLDPAPTTAQIAQLGTAYKFFYFAGHQIADAANDTTVQPVDRGLLLLRAQAEAMKELAARNMHKPVQLRDGMSGTPRNATPAALYAQLMEEFERQGQAA